MNVSLTKELERFVHERVKTGRYHSASEVVREGLRLLESREQLRELQLDEMRRRLVIGADVAVPRAMEPDAPEEADRRFVRPVSPIGGGRAISG
jgi:antitoxin ParD1/3/4